MDEASAIGPVSTFRLRGAWRRATVECAAVLFLLCSAACGAEPQPGAWGVITIGGATYRLPAAVFEDAEPQQGRQTSVLLNLPLVRFSKGSTGEIVRVLLIEIKDRDEHATQRHIQASIALNASVAASLDPHRRHQPLIPSSQPVTDAPPGLVEVAVDKADSLGEDVFVRPPLSQTAEFVRCSHLGGIVRYPSCSQYFAGRDMTVQASYPREYLSRWQDIRLGILSFLQQYRVGG